MREMKDSEVEWLGEIPSDWECIPSKYLFHEQKTLRRPDDIRMTSSVKYGIISQDEYRRIENFNVIDATKDLDKWKHVEPNDYIISLMSFKSGIEMSEVTGCVTWHYIVLRASKEICSNYYKWLFKSSLYCVALSRTSNFIRNGQDLRFSNFSKVPLPIPPLREQVKIADFLDVQCKRIQKLYSDIEKQISILEAYKKSLITECVTKGLNQETELKESGIEWAPEIPSHWKVMRNKYVMKKCKEVCAVYQGEDILSLTMNGVVIRDLDAGGKMPASFNGYQRVYPGNLLMCLFDYDVTPRCIGLIKNTGLTSPAYSQFVMKNGNKSEYYYYYYLMIDFTKELLHLAKNLRHSFTEEQLGMINAPVPPIEEQVAIAKYLDQKCLEIEKIIDKKKEQLTILEERRNSLVYEYTTGKKEVPES